MIWVLPSTIALIIKIFLFFYSDVRQNKYFFIFLIVTFLLNAFELLALYPMGYDLLVLKLYYCIAAFTALYFLLTCSDISQSCRWLKSDFLLVATTVLVATTLFTDFIILESRLLPNGSLTRVAGSYYFIFQIYALSALFFSLGMLLKPLIVESDYQIKSKCLIALLAFTPSTITIVVIMTLMQLSYKINMAGFLSISICFMLIMFISLNDKHKLFTMMSFVPFSRERAYQLKLKRLLKKFHGPIYGKPVKMKALLKEMELLVIENTQYYFATQKEVAQILDISEGSLSRKKSLQK